MSIGWHKDVKYLAWSLAHSKCSIKRMMLAEAGGVWWFLHFQCPPLDGSSSQKKPKRALGCPLWAVTFRSPVTPQHLDQKKKDPQGQTGRLLLELEEPSGVI